MSSILFNAESGLAEQVPTADAALAAGTHEIPLLSPEGEIGSAPHHIAPDLLAQGYKQPDQAQLNELLKKAHYQSTGQQIVSGLEAAGSAATLGGLTALERLGGQDPEAMRLRKELNPKAHMAGEIAGLGASIATGAGAASLMESAGASAAAKAATLLPETAMGRIGTNATKLAIENMIYQSGDEVSKAFMADPNQTLGHAMAEVGIAGLLGGVLGGATKGTGELWAMGPGKKLTQTLEALKNRGAGLPQELKTAANLELAPEIEAALGGTAEARSTAAKLMESNTKSAEKFQSAFKDFQRQSSDAVMSTVGKSPEELSALKDISKFETGKEFQSQMSKALEEKIAPIAEKYENFETQFKNAPISTEIRNDMANQINQVIVDQGLLKGQNEAALKLSQNILGNLDKQANAQDLRSFVQNLTQGHAFGTETYQTAKAIKQIFENGLERTIEGAAQAGEAGAFQAFKATQAEYRNVKQLLGELNDRLHLGKGAKYGTGSFIRELKSMDPESIVNRLRLKDDVGLQQLLDKHMPELSQLVKKQELNSLLGKSIDKSGEALDLKKLNKNIESLSPELRSSLLSEEQLSRINALHDLNLRIPQKMNPSGTAKTLDMLWDKIPASVLSMAAWATGHNPVIGALLGQVGNYLGKEAPDAVRLSMLKFLGSNMPTSATGFQAMTQIAKLAIKGEQKTAQASKAIFSGEASKIAEPTAAELSKIKATMEKLKSEPAKLMQMTGDIGHYMPELASITSMMTYKQLQYLESLKPQTAALAPLSKPRVASAEDESKFNNAVKIAAQPLLIAKYIKDGSLTMSDLQHIQNLHPEVLKNLQSKLSTDMVEHLTKNGTIPYKTKMSLSMLMGQPLEASLQPNAIIAAQPVPNLGMQPMPASRSQKLSKLPQASMTPDQARQAHKTSPH